MEPPVALSDCLFFLPVTSVADYELGTLRKGFRSDDAGVSQIVADDQIYLASRLRRFLSAI
jgi:hypothetical protein